jgi:hypothetical protein
MSNLYKSRCEGVTSAPITLQSVMGRLVHIGLGSSSLVAHVLHFPLPPREQICNRHCSNKHTHPALGGLQIPDGLVVRRRSCTSHPGVLGSIPKR